MPRGEPFTRAEARERWHRVLKPVVGRDPQSGLSYRLATADPPAVYAMAHGSTLRECSQLCGLVGAGNPVHLHRLRGEGGVKLKLTTPTPWSPAARAAYLRENPAKLPGGLLAYS